MKITYQLLDSENEEQLNTLYRWESDPEIYQLTTPIFKKEDQSQTIDKAMFDSKFMKSGKWVHEIHMIYVDEVLVGNFSMMMNPGHLFKKEGNSSWLGLTIGEKDYWGKGIAKDAMDRFEEVCREHKADRIELGVFEFNSRAQKFYQKLGYVEIGRIPNFTWHADKQWDDIRMEKIL